VASGGGTEGTAGFRFGVGGGPPFLNHGRKGQLQEESPGEPSFKR